MAQGPLTALRLYGVAASDSRSATSLAAGTSVVQFRGLSAIVEPSGYSRVDVNPEELSKYIRIVEEIHSHTPILPAPPGTVFRSRENLTHWLELHYFTLTEAIGQVEGHNAARLTLSVAESPKNEEAGKQFAALAAEALRSFRPHAAATVTYPLDAAEEGVIAKASFLVEVDKWKAFADAVGEEAKRHREFDFRLTGPWPPYDFVQMQFGG
jgi:hypothetical protein